MGIESYVMHNAVVAANQGDSGQFPLPAQKTFTGFVVGTGAVTATFTIKGSNNGVDWKTLATLTLTGTTRAADGAAVNEAWKYTMATLSNVTGTGAAATLIAAA